MRRAALTVTLLTAAFSVLAGQSGLHAEAGPAAPSSSPKNRKGPAMDSVRIRMAGPNGENVTATLEDSAAARTFRALLPLTLNLTDYNGTEKIGDLPKRLPIEGEPAGIDPEPGDVAYYAPWGNLAIFYRDFGYSRGLIRLGMLSHIPDAFRKPGSVSVTVEVVPTRD